MEKRNVTLSLPVALLKRVKALAAERDTSISALMVTALTRLEGEDRRYAAARRHALADLRNPQPLGTAGVACWTRDELHER